MPGKGARVVPNARQLGIQVAKPQLELHWLLPSTELPLCVPSPALLPRLSDEVTAPILCSELCSNPYRAKEVPPEKTRILRLVHRTPRPLVAHKGGSDLETGARCIAFQLDWRLCFVIVVSWIDDRLDDTMIIRSREQVGADADSRTIGFGKGNCYDPVSMTANCEREAIQIN